ncbi:MAG: diacylglycerol kinase family protein [Acidimicrobiia bacterium]|nr:diacylglycerol kinase family protein [Acidimicrobiia bacterium]
MPRLLLIANPLASGFTGATHREVMKILSETFDADSIWPNSPAESREASAKAAADGVEVVAGMGGDGVIHHIVNGIAHSDTALGIIPAGTTNVLGRILGLPAKPLPAASFLATNPPHHRIALGRIDATGPGGNLSGYAMFAAGLGLDAEVVRQAETTPHKKVWFGGLHYARSAGWMFLSKFRKRAPTMRAISGDKKADAVAVITQIHWPYTYFGRTPLRITPHPVTGLSSLIVEKVPPARAIGLAGTAIAGRGLERIPGMHVWAGIDELEVTADPPAWFQADGELLGEVGELHISFAPDALAVVAPR